MTLKKCYLLFENGRKPFWNRRYFFMKGYNTDSGYMGLVNGRYMLFASEEDYIEYISE